MKYQMSANPISASMAPAFQMMLDSLANAIKIMLDVFVTSKLVKCVVKQLALQVIQTDFDSLGINKLKRVFKAQVSHLELTLTLNFYYSCSQ